MGEETPIVRAVERNGRATKGVKSRRESSMDRTGVFIPHVSEGVEVIR